MGFVDAFPLPEVRVAPPSEDRVRGVVPGPGIAPMPRLWAHVGTPCTEVALEGRSGRRSGLGLARGLRVVGPDMGRRHGRFKMPGGLRGGHPGDCGVLAPSDEEPGGQARAPRRRPARSRPRYLSPRRSGPGPPRRRITLIRPVRGETREKQAENGPVAPTVGFCPAAIARPT